MNIFLIQKGLMEWRFFLLPIIVILLLSGEASAQTFNSGSTGADGAFAPAADTNLQVPPSGMFNFTTVDVPAGVTVTFTPNAANSPVTILASGNVTLTGTLDVSGQDGQNGVDGGSGAAGGPGGYRGGSTVIGQGLRAGAGLGPGGGPGGIAGPTSSGATQPGHGSFGTSGGTTSGPVYGTPELLPLLGGSGGGGGGGDNRSPGGGGGGGGGSILIASSGTITIDGSVLANGGARGLQPTGAFYAGITGGGHGSGGGIRLVANTIQGSGILRATEAGTTNTTGRGRIRLEATAINFPTASALPAASRGLPSVIELSSYPTLTIVSVGGTAAPAVPSGNLGGLDISLPPQGGPTAIGLAASGLPLGTTIDVSIKPEAGDEVIETSDGLAGTVESSTATANVTLPTGSSFIAASVTLPAGFAGLSTPTLIGGEPVEQIRLAAVYGRKTTMTFITKSGKEYPSARPE